VLTKIGILFYTRSLDFHAKVGILALLAFESEVVMPSLPKGEVLTLFCKRSRFLLVVQMKGTSLRKVTTRHHKHAGTALALDKMLCVSTDKD
jgi:hypothetical protein